MLLLEYLPPKDIEFFHIVGTADFRQGVTTPSGNSYTAEETESILDQI
jgi:hypothetical protein